MTDQGTLVYNARMHCDMHALMPYKDDEYCIYSDMLKVLARQLKGRLKKKYQNVIVVCGPTGSGKSTLALRLIYELNPDWDIRDNYIYDVSDLARKLKHKETADKISLYDEGSVSFNSLNHARKGDKEQVVLLDTCRSLGWTTVICIPSFYDLNKRIRDHLVDYVLMCPSKPLRFGLETRGFFEVFKPHREPWAKSTYFECQGAGVFDKLTGAIAEEYQAVKFEHQMRLLDQFTKDHGKDEDEDEEDE